MRMMMPLKKTGLATTISLILPLTGYCFFHTVHQGSARFATESDYGPFQKAIPPTGPMARANPIRFSTKHQDDETNLLYYGYRYYNASTGRWLSRDPAEEEHGGANLYGFVANNSPNYVDPIGLWFNDHDGLTQREFQMALGAGPSEFKPCYSKIIKVVVAANVGQDHGSAKNDLKRHFNRPIDQPTGSQAAAFIRAYTRYLADEENNFHTPLNMETPGRLECEAALKALGRMMHSWQDYYAHSVVLTPSSHAHTLWTATPPVLANPDRPGGSSGTIVPSSFGMPSGGEHGWGEVGGQEAVMRQRSESAWISRQVQSLMGQWISMCSCACKSW